MITITIDAKRAIRTLREDADKQIPFALANAINKIAKDAQTDERVQLRRAFTLRRPEWADRAVKITKFAKKKDPIAVLGIHPPGGDARADILTKFEADTVKTPRAGAHVAIPVAAKRTKKDIVRKNQQPRALIAAGKAFIIRQTKNPAVQLIVRYAGRGKRKTLETLWLLVRRVPISPDLKFEQTARKSIDRTATKHLQREFDNAMRTAR